MNFRTFVRAKAKGAIRDGTLAIYDKDRQQLTGRLSSRPLTVETAQDLEAWIKSKFPKANTQQRKITSLNWLLRWKGVDYQARRPPKEPNLHPQTVSEDEYRDLVARIRDPMERLAVRISHDSGWSPNDVAAIRKTDVDLSGDAVIVRRLRQKTNVVAEAALLAETAKELRAYLAANPDQEYVFPGDRRQGGPHRNRTWINEVLKRHGATFSPRAFRSNLATRWPGDDIKGLMVQGGWRDSRTIFQHYRGNLRERQVASLEQALDRPAKDRDQDGELPGYG